MKKIIYILLGLMIGHLAVAQTTAKNGVLDLRHYSFEDNTTFELDGEWEVYPGNFYYPNVFTEDSNWPQSTALYLPSTADWSDLEGMSRGLREFGYMTLRLTIHMPDAFPKQALMIRNVRTAYVLFVNGESFEGSGSVSQTLYNSEPNWRNATKIIDLKPGANELVMLVSNFHHARGGLAETILMGDSETIFYNRNLEVGGTLFLVGCLLLAGVFALGLFWFKTSEVVGLFFFLFCASFAVFVVSGGPHLLSSMFKEISWAFSIRVMWVSFYLSVIFYGYFLLSNFRDHLRPLVFHILATASIVMILITMLTPVYFFTAALVYYFVLLLVAAAGVALGALLQANFTHKLVWVNVLGSGAFFAIITYEMLRFFDVIGSLPMFYVGGVAMFILCQAMVMAIVYGRNYRDSSLAALAAAKTRDEFLNAMSHELKTPMNAILGMSAFLEKSDLNGAQRDKLNAIKENGESLMSMINDVLSISELDSGQLKLKKTVFSLENSIESAINLSRQHLKKSTVQFKYYIDPDIPELLTGDASRVKQILIHLLNNAFKFTSKGEVTLKVHFIENANGYVKIAFKLTDTGIGMRTGPRNILSIFTSDKPGKLAKYQGSGMGLSVTSDLLEMMGGELVIKSKKNMGTQVDFELTLEEYQPESAPASSIFVKNEVDTTLKILYAEDNPVNQKLMTLMLNAMGLKVDIASNGEEAVQMSMKKYYNIILMDIQMPVMDGLEASSRIVEHSASRPIIIATTANLAEVDKRKCFAVGMNDFITKPLSQDDLKLAILKWQGLKEYLDDDTNGSSIKMSS